MSKIIELGATYTDRITGFSGVATGFCTYISGCNQALLSPRVSGDGALRDAHWFDVQRLDPTGSAAPITLDNGETPGCDKPAPVR
ncbi:hypothetical protein [Xanthobacter aminoxidans]|uniref:hypothetical protein n=1 Tax=Xanthobacter aminoxidans TaxID=186280 RepID=UPI002022C850|nr:hypothetical protein [Xanthobacter aminoxidans]MCL8385535.1 hypothetical protein [Xanthobacter aminoxidans]